MERDDVLETLRKLRYDLSAAQSKLTEVMNALTANEWPDRRADKVTCPHCYETLSSIPALQDHCYRKHSGPLPDRDEAAETLAGLPPISR